MKHPRLALSLAVLCVVLAAFFESRLPYTFAEQNQPPAASFLGQVAHTTDQNMYFSFIRQAYDGNVLFNNRLTATPNSGAFVNLQFLAVGRVMRLFHLSENAVYQVWRFAGVLFLTLGFTFLSLVALPSLSKRVVSLCVFIFGGGFGALFSLAANYGLLSREAAFRLTPDLWSGLLPFQQLMCNPHFSLPHGLMLIGCALFLLAETRDQSVWLYVASGVIFLVNGFVRPYDLISLAVVIPVFIATEAIRRFDWRAGALRAIPLAIASPALVYSIWLFEYHPIFKYWSQQGHNIQFMPPPHIQMLLWQHRPAGHCENSSVQEQSAVPGRAISSGLVRRDLLLRSSGQHFSCARVQSSKLHPALCAAGAVRLLTAFASTRLPPRTVHCCGRRSAGYWQCRRPGPRLAAVLQPGRRQQLLRQH
jgi:hypothetical protein